MLKRLCRGQPVIQTGALCNLRGILKDQGYAVVKQVLAKGKMDAAMNEVRHFFLRRHDLCFEIRLWEHNQIGGMMGMKPSDLLPDKKWGSWEYYNLNKLLLQLHEHIDSSVLDDIYNITLPPNVDALRTETNINTSQSIFDILTDVPVLECVKHALGSDDVSDIDLVPIQQFRMKPPVKLLWSKGPLHASTGTTGWHQDRFSYHPDADEVDVVTCWMPFTDINIDMGALKVLPGSHKLGFQNHVPDSEEHPDECSVPISELDKMKQQHGLEEVSLEVSAGDLVMLDPLLLHRASENLSPRCRVSMDIRFCLAGSTSARPWFPSFNASCVTAEEYAKGWARAKENLLQYEVGQRLPQINRFHKRHPVTTMNCPAS